MRGAALLLLAPTLAAGFQLPPAAPAALRASVPAAGSRRAAAAPVSARALARGGVRALRAAGAPPPPPDDGDARALSKAELADLNIQLLEAGEWRPSGPRMRGAHGSLRAIRA
jgi:hypothetical protein